MIIAQITDTHIMPPKQDLAGMPEALVQTAKTLDGRLRQTVEHLNGLLPLPDVVLLTGDTTQNGDKESCQYLKELLEPLKIPVYIIPGNHDDRENLKAVFSDKPYMPQNGFIHYVIDDYPIRLIALDTNVPGESYGLLCEQRLDWLEKQLKADTTKPTLLFMHHFPMKVGVKCFDETLCRVEKDFEELIRSTPNIIRIVAGHYHRTCATLFGGKICFVAPSVAPAFYAADRRGGAVYIGSTCPYITLHQWNGGLDMTSESFQAVRMSDTVRVG